MLILNQAGRFGFLTGKDYRDSSVPSSFQPDQSLNVAGIFKNAYGVMNIPPFPNPSKDKLFLT